MNTLLIESPNFYIGEQGHPFCETGIAGITKKASCLVDTGFSLGFAFSRNSLSRFKFTNGYLITLLLGNGSPTKGIVFSVELQLKLSNETQLLGNTSVVFMEKKGDPLMGIESIRLFSPILMNWESNEIVIQHKQ